MCALGGIYIMCLLLCVKICIRCIQYVLLCMSVSRMHHFCLKISFVQLFAARAADLCSLFL